MGLLQESETRGKRHLGLWKLPDAKWLRPIQNHNHRVRSDERMGGSPHLAIKPSNVHHTWRTVTSSRCCCSSLLLVTTPLASQKPMSHPSPPHSTLGAVSYPTQKQRQSSVKHCVPTSNVHTWMPWSTCFPLPDECSYQHKPTVFAEFGQMINLASSLSTSLATTSLKKLNWSAKTYSLWGFTLLPSEA